MTIITAGALRRGTGPSSTDNGGAKREDSNASEIAAIPLPVGGASRPQGRPRRPRHGGAPLANELGERGRAGQHRPQSAVSRFRYSVAVAAPNVPRRTAWTTRSTHKATDLPGDHCPAAFRAARRGVGLRRSIRTARGP